MSLFVGNPILIFSPVFDHNLTAIGNFADLGNGKKRQ